MYLVHTVLYLSYLVHTVLYLSYLVHTVLYLSSWSTQFYIYLTWSTQSYIYLTWFTQFYIYLTWTTGARLAAVLVHLVTVLRTHNVLQTLLLLAAHLNLAILHEHGGQPVPPAPTTHCHYAVHEAPAPTSHGVYRSGIWCFKEWVPLIERIHEWRRVLSSRTWTLKIQQTVYKRKQAKSCYNKPGFLLWTVYIYICNLCIDH